MIRSDCLNPRAILLTLILVSSALAGCTGDPDGGANDEIDADTISNLQDFINGTIGPGWINDRGDSGHQWTLSLNDDQWLEVESVDYTLGDDDWGEDYASARLGFLMSDEGYIVYDSGVGEGHAFSPIFGGNYKFCTDVNELECQFLPLGGDRYLIEWSIIYRIHEVSPTNYYFNDSGSSEPALLEHQNITLHVSYVPSGSNESDRVYGNIVIELFTNDAPMHVQSFGNHITNGSYNNSIFHRIIDGFMIQGGDIQNQDGTGGYSGGWYGYCNGQVATTCDTADMTIPSEADNGLNHGPGTLAMARTSNPNSAGSQFYIVPSDSTPSHLDGSYTVFGQVTSGCLLYTSPSPRD